MRYDCGFFNPYDLVMPHLGARPVCIECAVQSESRTDRLWHSTQSADAFIAALNKRGYVPAIGEDRDFCVIDETGKLHNLRDLNGVTADDVHKRMAEINPDSLLTIAMAREVQSTPKFPRAAFPVRKTDDDEIPF